MGFDANIADPLAQFELKSEDFTRSQEKHLKLLINLLMEELCQFLRAGMTLMHLRIVHLIM